MNKSKKMKIIYKPITSLCAANYNPRKITEKQREEIRQSIRKFGTVEPLVINTYKGRENVIVGGHRRSEILQQEGHTEAPCVEVCLNQEDEKELNIRLNKNTGEFDYKLLESFFGKSELVGWGFEDSDFEGMFISEESAQKEVDGSNSDDDSGDNFTLPSGDKGNLEQITFTITSEQMEVAKEVLEQIKNETEVLESHEESFGNTNKNGNAFYEICVRVQ